jgi:predicted phage baseplate assembly protein
MPLSTITLDDRHFQDIVDEAKTRIPAFCPEWTDHNVSDPGVALIELFAWMTDMLLYRVNQVPDKMYVKFLEMVGVRLEPPRAAHAPVTFYLSAAQPVAVTIPEDTEVATVRTEDNPAIIFSTESDLTIRPPALAGAFTRDVDRNDEKEWAEHDIATIHLPGMRIPIFAGEPNPGDAFYLAFETDLSNHVVAIIADCEVAGGAGVDPTQPPIAWEVWQGGADRWAACEIEYDKTGGFNWSGEVLLHVPQMSKITFRDVGAYWLRCRMTEAKPGAATYQVSPEISRLKIESRGGTVQARHATTIVNQVIGRSDGAVGQTFRLINTPLLSRDPARDYLVVESPGTEPQKWKEVADFGDSGSEDRHYTLDSTDGTLVFGPALLQPDSSVYRFGAIPARGASLRFTRYQSGGGLAGNVQTSMLSVLKTSIPYVHHVSNRRPGIGGRDAQTLEDAKVRAPHSLRTRTRAVTADDFETLARQVPGVERSRCLTPAGQPGEPGQPRPGEIVLAVLRQVDKADGYIPPENLTLSAELKQAVESYLDERRLIGTKLDVQAPRFTWVSINATVRIADRGDPMLRAEVRRQAEAELYRYLNPYIGGPTGTGWPFGRDLHVSELYALLQRLPSVEFVEELHIFVREVGTGAPPKAAPSRLTLLPHGLICSDVHRVNRS